MQTGWAKTPAGQPNLQVLQKAVTGVGHTVLGGNRDESCRLRMEDYPHFLLIDDVAGAKRRGAAGYPAGAAENAGD